jgi:signal transduction histidine kinase
MSSAFAQSSPGEELHPAAPDTTSSAAENASGYYEELLHTLERLQQESDRRSVALAGAVHDLKTPLAVITGFVNLLLKQKLGVVSTRQSQALKDIAANCRRLDDAIAKLLFHSANYSRQQTLDLELTDLNSCIVQIRDMWTPVMQQKNVHFHCTPPQDVLRFPFDRSKVQQVISNLLENALKFTPAEGTVTVTAKPHFWDRRSSARQAVEVERRICESVRSNSACIVVSDTGPGIAPEYQQEIFEEFTSLSRPGIAPGIGLGLTIARHLVEAHQGKIWVESEAERGAKFCFVLPFAPQRATASGDRRSG